MKYQLFSLFIFFLGGPWFLENQCSQFFYQNACSRVRTTHPHSSHLFMISFESIPFFFLPLIRDSHNQP